MRGWNQVYEVLPDGRFKLKGGKPQPGNGAKKPTSQVSRIPQMAVNDAQICDIE
jgi:hypothetical protein